MKTPTEQRAATITEKALQSAIIDAAHQFHLIVAHFRPAMTQHGYRTAVAADGKGFPDLVIVGPGGVLFRELKSQKGKLAEHQQGWGEHLANAGADWGVWRPMDWLDGNVEIELRGAAVRPAADTEEPSVRGCEPPTQVRPVLVGGYP